MVLEDLGESLSREDDAVPQVLMAFLGLQAHHLLFSDLVPSAILADLFKLCLDLLLLSLISTDPVDDLLSPSHTLLQVLDQIVLDVDLVLHLVQLVVLDFVLLQRVLHSLDHSP